MLENAQHIPMQQQDWCLSPQARKSHARGAKLMDACGSHHVDMRPLASVSLTTAMTSASAVHSTSYPDVSKHVGEIGCASEGHK